MESAAPHTSNDDLAPRILCAEAVARLLGRSVPTFYRKRKRLEQRGFPLRSELLGGWHRDAVLRWIDAHFGLAGAVIDPDPWSLESSRRKLNVVSFKSSRRRPR